MKYLMQNTVERFGKLDFLVNNGGGQFIASFKDINTKGWNAVVDTNLNGTYFCLREGEHSLWILLLVITKREYGNELVLRVIGLYFRVPCSKPLGNSKVRSAFHFSEFGTISNRNFRNISVKHNMLAQSGFTDLW